MKYEVHHSECIAFMRTLPTNHVDAIVTDPPYELGFMGKGWDKSGIANSVEMWGEALRILKPGGHLLAFSGSRTYHRMTCAIEDAGFEIRDQIMWLYGSGFPKSLDVSKAIDKMDAAEEQQRRRFRFTEWVRSQGVTAKKIDEATGTLMGNHYTTHSTQPAIMTREHLEACRHLFQSVPDWVEQECDIRSVESRNFAEREVVGQGSGAISTRKELRNDKGTVWGADSSTFNITAPATDAARQWQGWGTALKPAHEPVCVARKPLIGTVAENVLTWGTGGVNVDGCRVEVDDKDANIRKNGAVRNGDFLVYDGGWDMTKRGPTLQQGRWPANLIHDGSEEVVGLFPDVKAGTAIKQNLDGRTYNKHQEWGLRAKAGPDVGYNDSGSAARFFYCAKASKRDRDEGCEGFVAAPRQGVGALRDGGRESQPRINHHPTVKPTELMRYLCRLVTPPNGIVFDPFMGSGSTGKAAVLEGFDFIGCDMTADYVDIARARIQHAAESKPNTLF